MSSYVTTLTPGHITPFIPRYCDICGEHGKLYDLHTFDDDGYLVVFEVCSFCWIEHK